MLTFNQTNKHNKQFSWLHSYLLTQNKLVG